VRRDKAVARAFTCMLVFVFPRNGEADSPVAGRLLRLT